MKRAAWCFLPVLIVALAGQSLAQEKKEAGNGMENQSKPPVVTLLEAGDAPRKERRIAPSKDATSTMTMTIRMNMRQTMGEMQMPAMKMPAMNMVMNAHVIEVHPNGDFEYDFTLSDTSLSEEAGLMPQVVATMSKALKSMVGVKGKVIMTNRGYVKSADIDIPPDSDPMAKQQLESFRGSLAQLSAPLPQEPVGVGGKWKVQTEYSVNGMTIHQESTMTLAKTEGDQLDIKVELAQTAPPQDMNPPGLPPGAKAHLNSLTSKGDGTLTIHLGNVFPDPAKMTTTSDQEMTLNMNGQDQLMKQHIEITMTMKQGQGIASAPTDGTREK